MKNLRKYVSLSVIMAVVAVCLFATTANASANFVLQISNTANTANTTNTAVVNTVNTAVVNTTNTVAVNTVNNISKDLPQTGENDAFIVGGIALVALAIGGVAFAKSKKYSY